LQTTIDMNPLEEDTGVGCKHAAYSTVDRCDVLFIHVDVCTTTIRIYTSVDDYRILSLTRSSIHTLFHVILIRAAV